MPTIVKISNPYVCRVIITEDDPDDALIEKLAFEDLNFTGHLKFFNYDIELIDLLNSNII